MGTSALISATICLLFTVTNAYVICGGQGNCGGGALSCPTGYINSGNSCVLSTHTGTSACTGGSCSGCTGSSCSTICPTGYYAYQNRCEKYTCPQHHVFSGGQCQYMGHGCQHKCHQGYELFANMCHMTSIVPCTPNSCTSHSSCQHMCYSGRECCTSQVIVQPQIVCPIYPPTVVIDSTTSTTTTPRPEIPREKCMNQTIYVKDSGCANISCPVSTKWDGQRCISVNTVSHNSSVDIKHFINNVNTINSPTNVNIKNDNNVFVYTADERKIDVSSKHGDGTSVPPTSTPSERPPQTTTTPNQPCCIVVTPRVCTQVSSKWTCYNRKYSRCGSFCKYPKIYLKPLRPIQRHSFLVVPPHIPCTGHNCGGAMGCSGCQTGGQCGSHCTEYFSHRDCSGCAGGGQCSSYCQDYNCGSSCQFYEQQDYCSENPGSPGCFEYDGCYEDWCSK